MDEASKLLEDMTVSPPQLPTAYHNLSLNPPVVDGMINLVPPSVSLVDQVVNLVTSLVGPVDHVVDLIPPIDPILPLESATQVIAPILSSVDPTLLLESETQMVDPFTPVDPIIPLENETQVVDLTSLSVDPTPSLESKPDNAHIFLIDTDSAMLGGIPPSLVEPPLSNEAIYFDWGVLTGPRLPSHIPFQITVQVCGQDVPQTLSSNADR
jgi:hypothetical protein